MVLYYPVTLTTEDQGAFTVTFPDIPEAITCGDDLEDALAMGLDGLETALEFYFEDKHPVPMPSAIGEHWVDLPEGISLEVLELNEKLAHNSEDVSKT